MKTDIHPKYFPNAKATCACGAVYIVGSTKEKIEVEICSACHPFYTGNEKMLDAAGRVEKFKARATLKKAAAPKAVVPPTPKKVKAVKAPKAGSEKTTKTEAAAAETAPAAETASTEEAPAQA